MKPANLGSIIAKLIAAVMLFAACPFFLVRFNEGKL
jgi:hypothetical protein